MSRLFIFFTVACISITTFLLYVTISRYFELPPPPKLDERIWWGEGEPKEEDNDIKPFKVAVPQTVSLLFIFFREIKSLKKRLVIHVS